MFLDGIIVSGRTPEEHEINLWSLLRCISAGGLKLNMEKCKFRQTELSFLRHFVSSAGRKPDLDEVETILQVSPLTELQGLHSFGVHFMQSLSS